jgi:hypothetical protein
VSDLLGGIPYPKLDPKRDLETNPLAKYREQLDPLAKLTDQLWQTPRAAPNVAPIQPPQAAMHLTQLGQQAMAPSPMAPPEGGLPPPGAPSGAAALQAAAPGPSAAAMAVPMPGVSRGTPPPASTPPWEAPGARPGGGPTDVTQFKQDPTTGGLVGRKARQMAALAPDVPTYGSPAGAAPEPKISDTPVQSRDQDRISTRIPSEAQQKKTGVDAHTTGDLRIGLESMKQAPEALEKNAQLIKNYPGLEHLRTNDPHKITEHFIEHMKGNIKWLYNRMGQDLGPDIVERSKKWYEGANRIAHNLATEFNVQPHQAAAVLAALSPQKDWYQNVELARRVMKAHQLGDNWRMTPEMHKYATGYIKSLEDEAAKQRGKAEAKGEAPKDDPKQIPELRRLFEKFQSTPMSKLTDPHERAVFARWHDEAHTPRDYNIINPEGDDAGTMMVPAKYTKKGKLISEATPRKVSWGSFNEIAKAMAAMQTADKATISRLMGGNHKVRNFYNNIIAPNNLTHGDITNDTHAIAAALFRPLGGKSIEVGHGLGTSVGKGRPGVANNAMLGNRGMYGLQAEAYRRAAAELAEETKSRVLPREVQSVTWEGIRGLFSPEQKRDPAFVKHIENIWQNRGQFRGLTPDERREAIVKHAGGLKLPTWAGGKDYGDDEED